MRRLCVAVLLAGCHASHPAPALQPAPAAAPAQAAPPAPAFDVHAPLRYEHGDGVARDFHAAAKMYADACRRGCGDLAACHGLLELAIAGRAVAPTLADTPIAARMCRRGDFTACIALAALGFDKGVDMPKDFHCKPGDVVDCEAAMWMDFKLTLGPSEGPPESPTADELGHRMTGPAAQLCAMHVADGCSHLLGWCRDRACVDGYAAQLQAAGVDPAPLRSAWPEVERACTAGDVDACDHAGRPVPAAELCAAGDDNACGHDRFIAIKALQHEVGALVASCRTSDHAACDRLAAATASACPRE